MTTAEYRDEISHLGDLIVSATGCLDCERPAELERVYKQWRALSLLIAQPKRCPKPVAEKRDRLLSRAVELIETHAAAAADRSVASTH